MIISSKTVKCSECGKPFFEYVMIRRDDGRLFCPTCVAAITDAILESWFPSGEAGWLGHVETGKWPPEK